MKEAREGSVEERRPEIDRETMTCCEKETQPTHLWYKRAAAVIGCDINKLFKLSLHSGIVQIRKIIFLFFNVTRNTNSWQFFF